MKSDPAPEAHFVRGEHFCGTNPVATQARFISAFNGT